MKVEEILPYNVLKDLYLDRGLSDVVIAKKFGLGAGQVNRLRHKYRIRTIEQYERHPYSELTFEEKTLIVGSLLGDGHMRKRGGKRANPELMIEQTVKHKEYIFWLKDCLVRWISNPETAIRQCRHPNKNGKTYHSYAFQCVAHPAFDELYSMFYQDGKKTLNVDLIELYFTPLSLAVWIMEYGFLSGNEKRNGIAINSFTMEEVNQLRNLLQKKYNLKSWICKRTRHLDISYEIHFDKRSSIEIRNLIGGLIVPSMKYKLRASSETTNGTTEK